MYGPFGGFFLFGGKGGTQQVEKRCAAQIWPPDSPAFFSSNKANKKKPPKKLLFR
jgi:hypothetical protein